MSGNVVKAITYATQFANFCEKLNIQGDLTPLELESLYLYAVKNGYDIALVEDYSSHVELHGLSYIFFAFLDDWDILKDLAIRVHLSEDLIDKTDDSDELIELITTQIENTMSANDFIDIVKPFLPAGRVIIQISSTYWGDFNFIIIDDLIFI